MNCIRAIFLLISFFLVQTSFSQKKKSPRLSKADNVILANLKAHIGYLAADKLEGRRAGTNGEKLAAEYISQKFRETGLQPKGTDGFFQSFEIYDGKQINTATHFIINENNLAAEKEFFPFPFSQNISVEALPSVAIQEADMPWFFDLKETVEENKNNPHFDITEFIRNNAKKAKGRGASAIILYNSSDIDDKLKFDSRDRTQTLDIPVIYVSKPIAKKYFGRFSIFADRPTVP
jgi:hypothetical protein